MANGIIKNIDEFKAACRQGGEYTFAADYFELKSQTVMQKPCLFHGADDNESIFTIPDDFSLPADVALIYGENLPGVLFDGIAYDGNSAEQSVPFGRGYFNFAELKNCDNLTIKNNHMYNAKCDAFRIRNTDGIQMFGNLFENLGHEGLYALSCSGIRVFDNEFFTRTNTGTRISYRGSDVKIYRNTFKSKHDGMRTGPAIEFDKGPYDKIEIFDNYFTDIYGAAIWAFSTPGSGSFKIHHNTIKNCGKYPGAPYSQGALNTAGIDGLEFYENIIDDVLYAIRTHNYEGSSKIKYGNYNVISRNNRINKAKIAYYESSATGSITATGDTRANVGTVSSGSVTVDNRTNTGTPGVRSTTTEPQKEEPEEQPVETPTDPENTTNSPEMIKATVRVTLPDGAQVDKTFDMESKPSTPSKQDTTVTCKFLMPDNSYANRTFTMKVTPEPGTVAEPEGTAPTEGNMLAQVKIRRANSDYGEATLLIPTTVSQGGKEGVIQTTFKARTPDGLYVEEYFDLELSGSTEPQEEQPEEEPEPIPEPTPEPEPETTPEPEPETTPEPEPEQTPEPEPEPTPDPIENTTPGPVVEPDPTETEPTVTAGELVKVTFRLWREDNKVGATTFSMQMNPEASKTVGTKVTCRLDTPDGLHAEQTFALNVNFTVDTVVPTKVIPTAVKDATGEKIKVQVKLRRKDGTYGETTFELPTTAVKAYAQKKTTTVEFKARTATLYADRKFELLVR